MDPKTEAGPAVPVDLLPKIDAEDPKPPSVLADPKMLGGDEAPDSEDPSVGFPKPENSPVPAVVVGADTADANENDEKLVVAAGAEVLAADVVVVDVKAAPNKDVLGFPNNELEVPNPSPVPTDTDPNIFEGVETVGTPDSGEQMVTFPSPGKSPTAVVAGVVSVSAGLTDEILVVASFDSVFMVLRVGVLETGVAKENIVLRGVGDGVAVVSGVLLDDEIFVVAAGVEPLTAPNMFDELETVETPDVRELTATSPKPENSPALVVVVDSAVLLEEIVVVAAGIDSVFEVVTADVVVVEVNAASNKGVLGFPNSEVEVVPNPEKNPASPGAVVVGSAVLLAGETFVVADGVDSVSEVVAVAADVLVAEGNAGPNTDVVGCPNNEVEVPNPSPVPLSTDPNPNMFGELETLDSGVPIVMLPNPEKGPAAVVVAVIDSAGLLDETFVVGLTDSVFRFSVLGAGAVEAGFSDPEKIVLLGVGIAAPVNNGVGVEVAPNIGFVVEVGPNN